METILQGVVNSSVPQDMYVFVSVCVWEVGEVDHKEFPSAMVHLLQLTVWEDIPCRATHAKEVQGEL